MEENLKYYTVYWRHGRRSLIAGNSVEDAFTRAGYGAGAIRAVDFYREGAMIEYERTGNGKEWTRIEGNPHRYFVPITTMQWESSDDTVDPVIAYDSHGVKFDFVKWVPEEDVELLNKAIGSYTGEGVFGQGAKMDGKKMIMGVGLCVMRPAPDLEPFWAHMEACRAA